MAEKIVQRRKLENELEAVDTGQLRLVYQPRYDIKSSVITSVEALVRWTIFFGDNYAGSVYPAC
jgi:sensor c-di-GMP phosphodiesterase-like protein